MSYWEKKDREFKRLLKACQKVTKNVKDQARTDN